MIECAVAAFALAHDARLWSLRGWDDVATQPDGHCYFAVTTLGMLVLLASGLTSGPRQTKRLSQIFTWQPWCGVRVIS